MNLDTKINSVLAALNDADTGLAAIKAAIPTGTGGTATDLTEVNAKLDALTAALAAVGTDVGVAKAAVTPEV